MIERGGAWRIAGVEVSRLVGSQPDMARGETGTFSVHLVPDGRGDHVDRYEQLMAYQSSAGEYDLYDGDGGGPVLYQERNPRLPLLVAVVPARDDPTGRGIWGVIDGITDETEVPQKRCLVDIDVLYLADLDQYATREQARAALEVSGGF